MDDDGYVSALADNPADADTSEDASGESPESSPSRVVAPLLAFGLVAIAVAVLLVVHAAQTPVATPTLVGLPLGVAQARILKSQLATGVVTVSVVAGYKDGLVIDQSPLPDAAVPRNARVDLVVARHAVETTVPDLFLAPSGTASQALDQRWLTTIECSEISSDVAFGRVISQLPAPGAPLMSDSQVAIVVSEGPGMGGVPVPDLVGKSAAQARATLERIYLLPVWLNGSGSPTATPAGVVTGQAFAPGAHTQVGSGVPLTLSTPGR